MHVCSDVQLDDLVAVCGTHGNARDCREFLADGNECQPCLSTKADASAWGAIVAERSISLRNTAGCVAAIDGDVGADGCGAKLYARDSCLSACDRASDVDACVDFASHHDCKDAVDAASACVARLGLDRTGTAFDVCGYDRTDDDALRALATFFCGR